VTLFDGLESAPPFDECGGTRLCRIEVFNWGTFTDKVWTFEVDGRHALLTGDIGSGKSTIVDAITTLLLPANKISYNKAAGADTRERDLRSYVLGHYKSERVETTGVTRPVALRGPQHYSVLLGVFASSIGEATTIAQVFRAREDGSPPERFFVVANGDLAVTKQFADFGTKLPDLKRRLRDLGARLYDHFPEYGRDLRRRLGIASEQALELFHQTVSMKAVDNLNDFVRGHMLEPFDMAGRVKALTDHFDDLTAAHDAVVRAKDQLSLLEPVSDALDAYDRLREHVALIQALSDAVPYFFAERLAVALDRNLHSVEHRLATLAAELGRSAERRSQLDRRRDDLTADIARQGGDRIASLESELEDLTGLLSAQRRDHDSYGAMLADVGLNSVSSAAEFDQRRGDIERAREHTRTLRTGLDNELAELQHQQRAIDDEVARVNAELRSLEGRRSNLPSELVAIRGHLASELDLDGELLPFAGELIQVRADAVEWEGAAERVLRGFAISLLVPDHTYEAVARWIDDRHLGQRFVYFRVPNRVISRSTLDRSFGAPLLVDMLEIDHESPYGDWIIAELDRHADHACVASTADFRRVARAVTRNGQIKARDRHEKDDRHDVNDRRHYVLGWSNERKIDALIVHGQWLTAERAPIVEAIGRVGGRRADLDHRSDRLAVLAARDTWSSIDWMTTAARVDDVHAEIAQIKASSDVLATLTAEREKVDGELKALDDQVSERRDLRGRLTGEQERLGAEREKLAPMVEPSRERAAAETWFDALVTELGGQVRAADVEGADWRQAERMATEHITAARNQASDRAHDAEGSIIRRMGEFRRRYPAEVSELDDSVGSAAEYRQLHARVAGDDLPRFAAEFRRALRENTIQEIAGLSAELRKQDQLIRDRVATINRSLAAIDYRPGTYIQLDASATPNTEIRDFREQLRVCTTNIVVGSDDDQYSEQRFFDVKSIIDRFKGRESYTEADRRWTARVTDVRQWSTFTASERWRHDDSEYETYSDSDGKSGGQKEKLAYTVLASSLAYQYQVDPGRRDERGFRFVVIDEAFGRGSDESTRYALDLFTRLGLQMLIVTPLQKIRVIEPYVQCLGYVDNLDGRFSRVQRVTIEELHTMRTDGS
jgi:uncharacterized protein YPO0396